MMCDTDSVAIVHYAQLNRVRGFVKRVRQRALANCCMRIFLVV